MAQPFNPHSPAMSGGEDVNCLIERQKISHRIKQTQIIGLVAGIAASVFLLLLLLLQMIPGIPIAFSIIFGVATFISTAIALGAFSIFFIKMRKMFSELAEASSVLRDSFVNCSLDLAYSLEPHRFKRTSRYRRSKRPQPQPTPIPGRPTIEQPAVVAPPVPEEPIQPLLPADQVPPPVPAPAEGEEIAVPEEEVGEADITEVPEELFVRNQLKRLLDLSKVAGKYPTIEQDPRYKKEHSQVAKQFGSFCIGLTNMIDKGNKKLLPISKSEAVSMFMRPMRSVDSHSVLRITCNGRDVFGSEVAGAFWLQDVLKDPRAGHDFLKLLEMVKTSKDLRGSYSVVLKICNFFLSGWCLGNSALLPNILGSLQRLPIDSQVKEDVIELMASGNVLGALCILHEDSDTLWRDFLTVTKPGTPEAPQDLVEEIPVEELDLSRLRGFILSGDLAPDVPKDNERILNATKAMFARLAARLPKNILSLGLKALSNLDALKDMFLEIYNFFKASPPKTTAEACALISGIRSVGDVQIRMQAYLPFGAKEMVSSLFSTLVLGGFTTGLFTKRQLKIMGEVLEMSEEELQESIQSRKMAKKLLPHLLK
ncbi:CT214 family putative inclusion membrane protein [Chlamydia vaughanii]|uniref:CT214 family putative inclusion membrane protein n=1 Tax=Chlamydia vaughanii TaxID=3112552 RepID=UPI0032B2B68C